MQLTGSYKFNHEQQAVWDVLMNPDAIAKALPGVDELIPVEGEPDTWRADAKLGIATVRGKYSGIVKLSEQNPPNQYRLTVSGSGQNSIIDGTTLISLSYDADNQQTILNWEADVQISGKLASIGQRLIGAAANMMSKQFFQGLEKQLPKS